MLCTPFTGALLASATRHGVEKMEMEAHQEGLPYGWHARWPDCLRCFLQANLQLRSARAAHPFDRDSRLGPSRGKLGLSECIGALPVAGGFGPRGPPGPFPPFERNGFMDRGPPMMDMGGPMMMDMGALP